MNAIINLGNPTKDIETIAKTILRGPDCSNLKITGVTIFCKDSLLITSCCYGAGMTWDCLQELHNEGFIMSGDSFLLVGSMGSLCDQLALEQILIPNPCLCAYYGFQGKEVFQNNPLLELLRMELGRSGISATTYRHGSSFAVFDPHTDMVTYKSSLYDASVQGLDCGEVFVGLELASQMKMSAAAVLYCSDSPKHHIADIGDEEFNSRASARDLFLNEVGARLLRGLDHLPIET